MFEGLFDLLPQAVVFILFMAASAFLHWRARRVLNSLFAGPYPLDSEGYGAGLKKSARLGFWARVCGWAGLTSLALGVAKVLVVQAAGLF